MSDKRELQGEILEYLRARFARLGKTLDRVMEGAAVKKARGWLPMKDAPKTAVTDVSSRHSRIRQGTAIALLCWRDDGDTANYVLVRGCWMMHEEQGGWFDLDGYEPIDLPIVGWMPLPADEERKALLMRSSP